MHTLKLKISLKLLLHNPIVKSGYQTHEIDMDEINFNSISEKDIDKLDGQYDWIDAWMDRDYDKEMAGFNNKDVQMEVVYEKGNYLVTLVSEMPFDTIVTYHRYYSRDPDCIVRITLKEAIMEFMDGCISDGIGENPIGCLTYQGEKCEVWLGDLIEI